MDVLPLVLFRFMKLAQKFQEEAIEGMRWLLSKTRH